MLWVVLLGVKMIILPNDHVGYQTSELILKDNNDKVIGTIKPKPPQFNGTYWYFYDFVSKTDTTNVERSNIPLLLSLSPSGHKMFFIILSLLANQRFYSSEITITRDLANRCLQQFGSQDPEQQITISKGSYYSAIRELIKIDFIKRVKKDTYKVNSNYVSTRRDQDQDHW